MKGLLGDYFYVSFMLDDRHPDKSTEQWIDLIDWQIDRLIDRLIE